MKFNHSKKDIAEVAGLDTNGWKACIKKLQHAHLDTSSYSRMVEKANLTEAEQTYLMLVGGRLLINRAIGKEDTSQTQEQIFMAGILASAEIIGDQMANKTGAEIARQLKHDLKNRGLMIKKIGDTLTCKKETSPAQERELPYIG